MSDIDENDIPRLPSECDESDIVQEMSLSRQQITQIILGEKCGEVDESNSQRDRTPEKRMRQESEEDIDEEGFITVRNKRLARSFSRKSDESEHLEVDAQKFVVCVTGKTNLPKKFGMAKLLKSEHIEDILNIQVKNPTKVHIEFANKHSAEKLVDCQKFKNLDFRCSMLNETNFTYGIVRDIDLDIVEEEILENFHSNVEIVSVRRLKRQDDGGMWVDCTTVRTCFKSSTLPTFITGYGCRFTVEPYTFPVSQCSGCWKFGHHVRACPTKKIICPKCGDKHPNCETHEYKCVNCKGNHMALNKTCPMFVKEKEIRSIMTKQSCSYRKALSIYLEMSKNQRQEGSEETQRSSDTSDIHADTLRNYQRTYRDALLATNAVNTEAEVHMDADEEQEDTQIQAQHITDTQQRQKRMNKRKSTEKNIEEENQNHDFHGIPETTNATSSHSEQLKEKKKPRENTFNFNKYLLRFGAICISETSIASKLKMIFSFLVEDVIKYILGLLKDNDIISNFIKLVYNG